MAVRSFRQKLKIHILPVVISALLTCGCTDISKGAPAAVTDPATAEAAAYTDITDVKEQELAITAQNEDAGDDGDPEAAGDGDIPLPDRAETSLSLQPETTSVTIVCAGDNLIHTPIYRIAHETAGDGGYDFSPAYEHLGTLISEADLAILNQETLLSDDFPPSSYPLFCTPTDMARDMTKLGFDAFSISNNHVLDKGEEGLISSLDFWRSEYPDIPVYGAYRSEEDMNNIRTLDVNGIRFAFLGYMAHTNGLYLPASSQCRITYLSELETIEKQIRHAKEIADCVIVSPHFGIEVSNIITNEQRTLSREFAEWGADIIIGTQPHTIQSMEYLDTSDGRRAFVFYCLGNLISTMDDPLAMAEILGRITVTKDASGSITLSDPEAVPLVNYYDRSYTYVGVYPLSEYSPELASTHCVSTATYEFILRLFRENIPREFMDKQYDDLIYG